MGTITISLSDEVEKKLRAVVKHMYGSSKGGLSKVIENALENYFGILGRSADGSKMTFKALKGGAVVAEGGTLEELASALRRKGVEPRGLRIVPQSRSNPWSKVNTG